MNAGWVKVPRDIQKQPWWDKAEVVKLYLYIHMNVSFEPYQTVVDGQPFFVKIGQMVTGRKALSKALSMSESAVERGLQMLSKCAAIEQQMNRTSRCISVPPEDMRTASEQQMNRKQTANEHLSNNKNNNKKKNDDDGTPAVDEKYYWKLFYKLEGDELNMETVMKNFGLSAQQYKYQLQKFFREKRNQNKQWTGLGDCKANFYSWLGRRGELAREQAPEEVTKAMKDNLDDFYDSRLNPADRI